MYGTELSNRTIPPIAKMVRSFAFEEGQSTYNLWRYTDKLDSYAKNLFRVLVDNVPDSYTDDEAERFKTVIDGRAGQYLRKIGETLGLLAAELEERQVLRIYAGQYAYIMRELANVREQIAAFGNHDDLIYWLEAPEGLCSLTDGSDEIFFRAIPKRLDEMLRTDLWGKGVPVVLTSGTLSTSGRSPSGSDFTHIKQSFGLDRLKSGKLVETSKPSPYNYRENALLYISESVPFPDKQVAEDSKRSDKRLYTPNIFKGKVFCGHCGISLHRQRSHDVYWFRCITRNRVGRDSCVVVSIKEQDLTATVLTILQKQIGMLMVNYSALQKGGALIREKSVKANAEIMALKQNTDKNRRFLRGLYESLTQGILTSEEYFAMRADYHTKISRDMEQAAVLEAGLLELNSEIERYCDLARDAETLNTGSELTAALVEKLVSRIEVFPDRQIEVKFAFEDEFQNIGEVLGICVNM